MLQTRGDSWENDGGGSDDGDAYDAHLFSHCYLHEKHEVSNTHHMIDLKRAYTPLSHPRLTATLGMRLAAQERVSNCEDESALLRSSYSRLAHIPADCALLHPLFLRCKGNAIGQPTQPRRANRQPAPMGASRGTSRGLLPP